MKTEKKRSLFPTETPPAPDDRRYLERSEVALRRSAKLLAASREACSTALYHRGKPDEKIR